MNEKEFENKVIDILEKQGKFDYKYDHWFDYHFGEKWSYEYNPKMNTPYSVTRFLGSNNYETKIKIGDLYAFVDYETYDDPFRIDVYDNKDQVNEYTDKIREKEGKLRKIADLKEQIKRLTKELKYASDEIEDN